MFVCNPPERDRTPNIGGALDETADCAFEFAKEKPNFDLKLHLLSKPHLRHNTIVIGHRPINDRPRKQPIPCQVRDE
jgi:hypothetical protein